MRHARRDGLTPFAAGAIGLVLLLIVSYLVFAKDIPFTRPYEVKAVFQNASGLRPDSPVRIAGVEVGKVKKIESQEDSTAAVVTMQIKDDGRPIHEDAEMKIRPRIFLEGNFFVDVRPGTPRAGELDDGGTIPATQTSAPIQLDQVLTSLQRDTRDDLQRLLRGYGDALYGKPARGEDRDQDRAVRGKTAAAALNKSLDYSPQALRGIALVNDALLGTETHDLSKLIAGSQKVFSALGRNESQLKDLITNFNRTTAAFASEEGNLRRSIGLLPGTLENANDALVSLNAAFPPTRAFAREILPGVRETPATIDAAFPWIAQTRKLVSPAELQGLARDLRPAVDDLAQITDDSVELFPQVDLVSRCMLDVVLPTGDYKIEDGFLTTGLENYKEFWQAMVGLSGEGQNFDGNGQYTRFQTGGGDQTVRTGPVGSQGPLFANMINPPIGTRPKYPGRKPPVNRKTPCHTNKPPDLNSAQIGSGP
jgi:phospholipid/cholesterol/gamma-HCH transport system substrate-binding protein